MPHSRSEFDVNTDPWPREVDTRPGNLGDWPPVPRTSVRPGRARHRRRQRGRHRAGTATTAADLTELAPDLTGERSAAAPAPVAAVVCTSAATVGPIAVPSVAVAPLDLAPAALALVDRTDINGVPPETPAEQTRPAGWWRDPRPAEPQHPRARPPAPAVAAAASAAAAERDRRPWLAGTALFVAALITGTAALATWKHPGEQLPPPDTTAYGATGRLPAASALADDAQEQRPGGRSSGAAAATYTAAATGTGGGAGAAAGGDPRIPAVMELAYRGAEARLDATASDCGLSWSLLAGIGKVESDHAQGGNLDDDGTTREPILGPALDGTNGNAMIADTDRGVLDGDTRWDRAVGPSQFIPTSWDIYGADGNDDGRADPNNAYDAAVATGRYLCAGDLDLTDPGNLNTAVFRYNHSQDYVDTVLSFARTYAAGTTGTAGSPPPQAASGAPGRATVIPVPPLPVAPARPALKTPTTAPTTAPTAGSSTPRAQHDTTASSPTPAPRSKNAENQGPHPANPRSAPPRPSHRAAPPAPSHRAAPPTTSSPRPATPAPTSSAPTRRPVPRTTTGTTTPETTTPETTTPETTTPETTTPETTTPESPSATSTSPTTDPQAPGELGCARPLTVPTPGPVLEPGLPGGALLDDLAAAITLLRDCCNDQ